MAGRYLPTELQSPDGDVIYPHTQADIVWMPDGRNLLETLKEKSGIVISSIAIPVDQRTPGTMYAFIEGETAVPEAAVAKASPAVGYKMIH